MIIENIYDKNPRDAKGMSPLHFSALMGNFEVHQFLMDNVDEKNPEDNFSDTPLSLTERIREYCNM